VPGRKDDRDSVCDREKILEAVRKMPQTYRSLLGTCITDGTAQLIVRNKVNQMLRDGDLCRASIPGTPFGKALFYILPKKYTILVEAGRTGSEVFCFVKYEHIGNLRIEAKECQQLTGSNWKMVGDKGFFEGNVLLWI
jgi:hypothetical protein